MRLTPEEILKTLKIRGGRLRAFYVDVSERKIPNVDVTAAELNSYVESKDLLGQGDKWIELSAESSFECLFELVESIDFRTPEERNTLPNVDVVVASFFVNFSSNARYFANGIYYPLKSYPVIEGFPRGFDARRPFMDTQLHRSMYAAWNPFKADPDEDALGIVAVDEHKIGYMLINCME